MILKRILTAAFLIVVVLLAGCDDDESPLVVTVNPQTLNLVEESGNNLFFQIEIKSKELINQFTIKQKDTEHGIIILLDSVPLDKNLFFDYTYKLPFYADSTEVMLEFTAKSNGYFTTIARRILIRNSRELLNEFSGNVFFSSLSGKANGFNIKQMQNVFSKVEPDSLIDFMDSSIDSINGNQLSRKWISPAGLKFVRFTDFNYATATREGVSEAYNVATKYNFVANLNDEDIIMVGRSEAYAVIKITQIVDADSTLNDKYYFNLKPL